MALIDHIDWHALDKLVAIQQRNREAHSPVVSLYRWWARRPHAVAGALLDAAICEFGQRFTVADPFSGGGTVAFEAVRRGLDIYAQDLYPWPGKSLAVCLDRADPDELCRARVQLLEKLSPYRKAYRRREAGRTLELSHTIRVRVGRCPDCREKLFLFRDPFVSLASRRASETRAFFGCSSCGSVSNRSSDVGAFRCNECGESSKTSNHSSFVAEKEILCRSCGKSHELSDVLSESLDWKPVLVQEYCPDDTSRPGVLREVEPGDPVVDSKPSSNRDFLSRRIPRGMETNHLLRSGFKRWSDIYTNRQIEALVGALDCVNGVDADESIKGRLHVSLVGACEMAGYLCRWERHHPKALEALSNHRYSRSTVVVETNLLSTLGRGTIPRRLDAAERGLRWLSSQVKLPRSRRLSATSRRRRLSGAVVAVGSSQRQLPAKGSVKFVLTDPPYHDDVQYGELARIFHAWLKAADGSAMPSEKFEAVPNNVRGTDTDHFRMIISGCLRESRRTLAQDGRLVLTFHNKDVSAWESLADALKVAGFAVIGIATVSAENSADHSKRGKQTFLCDLVIECVPCEPKQKTPTLTIRGRKRGAERRNLLEIGKALASRVNDSSDESVSEKFHGRMSEAKKVPILIR